MREEVWEGKTVIAATALRIDMNRLPAQNQQWTRCGLLRR